MEENIQLEIGMLLITQNPHHFGNGIIMSIYTFQDLTWPTYKVLTDIGKIVHLTEIDIYRHFEISMKQTTMNMIDEPIISNVYDRINKQLELLEIVKKEFTEDNPELVI